VAQVQALWITAYLGNKIPSLAFKSSYVDENVEWNTVLYSQFGKWRHPAAAGGYGKFSQNISVCFVASRSL
jgi:hypothetical protein